MSDSDKNRTRVYSSGLSMAGLRINLIENKKKDKYKHKKLSRLQREERRHDKSAAEAANLPSHERIPLDDVQDKIHGIKCKVKKYHIPPEADREKMRWEFDAIRKDWIINLAKNHRRELKKLGLTAKQISSMKRGATPKGYNTHHIVPIHGGGTNDYSNLCLIKRTPYHDDLHYIVINPQIRGMKEGDTRMIKIPIPDGKVFIPPAIERNNVVEEQHNAMKEKTEKNVLNDKHVNIAVAAKLNKKGR